MVATLFVFVFTGSALAEANSRFSSSQETGGAPGRYRVELELRPGDDLVAVSSQLAATYGARIEPYAEEGFSGFAIIATPARARLMSSDPRVVSITDLNPPVSTDTPRGTQATEAPVAAKTAPLAVAVEQQGRGIATEAVPGFGSFLYDPSGNITTIDNQSFRYDPFGRLLTADLDSFGTMAYTYDRYGNILTVVTDGDDAHAVRMSVDPETNQMDLPFSQSNPANMIATYDGVGNVITHNGTFIYDALNMMKETTDAGRRLHVYSASDERVAVIQVANGVEASSEWTLRDGGNRVLRRFVKDVSGTWHWKEDYIYGGTRLLAAEVPGSERVRHFHLDHLGTPRLITGNGGVRIAEKTYEPFGPKVSPATNDFEQLEFTGHERDTPALDYMHARYYQPDLRRFLSVDPVIQVKRAMRNPQMWNRYSYALNNPIVYTDPTGETVYLVTYTTGNVNGDEELRRAALTRAAAIRNQKGFDPKKDTVLVRGVRTIGDFNAAAKAANALAPKFGQVGNLSHFSHAGRQDGPQFHDAAGNETYFKWSSLSQLDVNWAPGASASFYGCNTARCGFTKAFANAQGVPTSGFGRYTYFSSDPNERAAVRPTGPVYMIDAMGQENFFLPLFGAIGRLGADAQPMIRDDPDE